MSVQNNKDTAVAEYNFREIEKKWQAHWEQTGAYKVPNQSSKPKYYVLDMFPYPSGAGLHVGHPLGYIASDIFARYKRNKGFNVLHPMGYDAFGLPAEQYAIEHGVHPAVSTAKNIDTFRKQLDKIGFCFDWSREVNTSHPQYYKWTQWIFLQLFDSWYNRQANKTESIETLIALFEKAGNESHPIPNAGFRLPVTGSGQPETGNAFTAEDWKTFDEKTKQAILMEYRIAYCGYGEVNWCEALGTVLANDEVVNGMSERGGYPVEKKRLRQWYLRITEYADRLLQGLQTVDFSDAMKEMQGNWIGKSTGAEIEFNLTPRPPLQQVGEGENDSMVGESFPKYAVSDRVQFENARRNRKASTETELILWEQLRNSKTGYKFRRQHPVDGFIADFACLQRGLIVEVDGGYHHTPAQQAFDQERTQILEAKGFTVLRFTNDEVSTNAYAVLDKIKTFLDDNASATNQLKEEPPTYRTSRQLTSVNDSSPLSSSAGEGPGVRCYTTRPDTIFGVDFMVIAPEHELVERITTPEQKTAVEEYIAYVKSRSERERMAEKKITGVATGAYAINPFDGRQIPVWISEYVLAGYGTGAIMAVPCGDERDHKFAQHFGIPITNIIGDAYNGEEANPTKDAVLTNSGFLNGTVMREAIEIVVQKLEDLGIGQRKTNYKMRDAAFSRQRYWGEPFPIKWLNGVAYPLAESELPLELPQVESYSPGPEGEGPLANMNEWIHQEVKLKAPPPPNGGISRAQPSPIGDTATNIGSLQSEDGALVSSPVGGGKVGALETNTMPGYAGSSWYFLRYMDPHNDADFCEKSISDYWNQVDLYVGGTEHAVGHLLYSRMWTKALYDLGYISFDEPFKKLLNQGMIQGSSRFVYKVQTILFKNGDSATVSFFNPHFPVFISKPLYDVMVAGTTESSKEIKNKIIKIAQLDHLSDDVASFGIAPMHVNVDFVDGFELDQTEFRNWKPEFENAALIFEGNKFICGSEVEKMSKSKFNTVNPDYIVEKYGADTFRMYEMFLGPVEMSKPWETKGIEGVHRFLKKLWRLYLDEQKGAIVNDETPTAAELKVLHRTIKKIEDDIERFSFNTCVSAFMVCVNELSDLKCHKRAVLEPLLVLLTPFAPHVAEELYQLLGNTSSVLDAPFPLFEERYIVESTKEYPVSINGRLRTTMNISLDATQPEVEAMVLANEVVQKWLEGKPPKKFIFVKGKMVNLVV